MRNISLIIIHCSGNQEGSPLRCKDIDNYHRSIGRNGCGYHYVIPTSGAIEEGRSLKQAGAHCKPHNRHSIGICYIGGLSKEGMPKDTRTSAQRTALRRLLEKLHQEYPQALIVGHRDLNPQKTCPCFNVIAEYLDLEP